LKDLSSDMGKEHLSGCRSTIDDLNTVQLEITQEELNLDSPQLLCSTRSLQKVMPGVGFISPQVSSSKSQVTKQMKSLLTESPFQVIRTGTCLPSLQETTHEVQNSNNFNDHKASIPNMEAGSCRTCTSNKKLIFYLPNSKIQGQCHPCLEKKKGNEIEQFLAKPLAEWHSSVQPRSENFYIKEEKTNFANYSVISQNDANLLNEYLSTKLDSDKLQYEAAFTEVTSLSHQKLPISEKITTFKIVHDLMEELITTRGLLEDLENNKITTSLWKLLPKARSCSETPKCPQSPPTEDSDCEISLGKREPQPPMIELSRFFSWAE